MLLPLVLSILIGLVSTSQVSVCIMNCGQCKMMLGPYFKGPACAHSCLATFGMTSPDCNNPYSVKAYLKRII
uniref:Eclosion hormone 2 n=1 Tax=Plautia stali TaxID=106108 RepID=A0A1E1G7S9_PLAST|nr:eclosion hormone 2 [Plautia stali]